MLITAFDAYKVYNNVLVNLIICSFQNKG